MNKVDNSALSFDIKVVVIAIICRQLTSVHIFGNIRNNATLIRSNIFKQLLQRNTVSNRVQNTFKIG